jgi:hypothetical protein
MTMTQRHMLAGLAVAAFAALVPPAAGALQQEVPVIEQDIEVAIDRLGNADISATFTLPAAQWRLWNQTYGQNEFLLKRDFEHQFSAVELYDFKLERDEMNRTATLRMKGAASAEYRGNGVWEAELEKGARGTKVSDTVWQFSKSSAEGGAILQQTFRVKLPEGARGAEQVAGELGVPVLRYELRPAHRSPVLLVAGGAAGAAGLALLLLGLLRKPASA